MGLNLPARRCALTLVLVFTLSFAGACGSSGPTGKLHGKITLNGAAVPAGSNVMFVDGPEPTSATTDAEGKYTLPKPVKIGTYTVVISEPSVAGDPAEQMKASMAGGAAPKSPIPAKYSNPATSGEKVEIKVGDTEYNLDMKEG